MKIRSSVLRSAVTLYLLSAVIFAAASAWPGEGLKVRFLDAGSVLPNPPLTDRPATFPILVCNEGDGACPSFTLTLVLDGVVRKSWRGGYKGEEIEPGACRLYQYAARLKEGVHQVRWSLQGGTGGEAAAKIIVQQPPDLVVTAAPVGGVVVAYKGTEWEVTVRNIGKGDASRFSVLFSPRAGSEGIELVFPTDQTLLPGGSYTFNIRHVYKSLEPIEVAATVDYHGEVTEALPAGEDNNRWKGGYTPKFIDLAVTDFTVTPAQLYAGEEAEVSFSVQNKGDLDAVVPFTIAIIAEEKVTGSIQRIQLVDAQPVAAGASVQYREKLPFGLPGAFMVRVLVDAPLAGAGGSGSTYSEPERGNNVAEAEVAVAEPRVGTTEVTSCQPGKGVVRLYRVTAEGNVGTPQPYIGFIQPIEGGFLSALRNTTGDWKVMLVDSFNLKGVEAAERYGGGCWDRIPWAFLEPGGRWAANTFLSLKAGRLLAACVEGVKGVKSPDALDIEYEYSCRRP